jgi:DNA-binding MarR family transcriptional regulator
MADPLVPNPARVETLEAVRGVLAAAEKYREALVSHFRLGRSEGQAIRELAASDGLGQTELASRLGVTAGAITGLIDRLQLAGLAQRTSHASDRRRTVVSLTVQGQALVEQGRDSVSRLVDGLDPQNLGQVTKALNTITQNMEQEIQRL